jgi:hypothetical protein
MTTTQTAMTTTQKAMTTTQIEGSVWAAEAFSKTPHHIRVRLNSQKGPTILVEAQHPYNIVAANSAWQNACGYGAECIGMSPKILQGKLTDVKEAARFRNECALAGKGMMTIANYTKTGEPFVQHLRAAPVAGLDDPGRTAFYLTEGQILSDGALHRALLHKAEEPLATVFVSLSIAAIFVLITCQVGNEGTASMQTAVPSVLNPIRSIHTGSLPFEGLPAAVMLLLSFTVVSIKDVVDKPACEPPNADESIGIAVLLALSTIAVEAPMTSTGSSIAAMLLAAFMLIPKSMQPKSDQTGRHVGYLGIREIRLLALFKPPKHQFKRTPLLDIAVSTGLCSIFLISTQALHSMQAAT